MISGQGAGFYLDARRSPMRATTRMETYITAELPDLGSRLFPGRQAASGPITGHSMADMARLTLALRPPGRYRCVSAFAPIVAPSQCPGEKALGRYLGPDRADWRAHDAVR
jgi:S-formylglutathione hydrolase